MEALSLDHFKQQQNYQRALLIGSSSEKHHKKRHHKHRSHKKRRSSHSHRRHHRRKSRKDYGDVNDQCAVCLDDETELDTRLFPCKHVFHGPCLIEWVRQGESFTCPLCRQEISHFFNLSNDEEINDELVSIWNDYYIRGDDTSDQTVNKLEEDEEVGSKNISVVVENEIEQVSTRTSSLKEVVVVGLEEIAKLKNREINKSLGITDDGISIELIPMVAKCIQRLEKSEITQDTQFGLPSKKATSTEVIEVVQSKSLWAPVTTIPLEKIEPAINKTATVWKSTWSTIACKIDDDSKTLQESLIRVFVPNNTFISLIFDQYISKTLMSGSIVNVSNSNSVKNEFNYDFEFNRINKGMNVSIDNRKPESMFNPTQMYESIMTPSNMCDNNEGNKSDELVANTSLNCEAGIYAGIGASLTTYALTHSHHRIMPYILRSSLIPLMKQTVPSVAAFFTTYEHLKAYAFDCDASNKSHYRRFGERFISAGIASSIAFLPRSNVGVGLGLKCALPLRFATFFGGFEFCKDARMEFKFLKGNYNNLNLFEIGSAATIGGVIASSVHYPITQFIQHGGKPNNLLLLAATRGAGASTGASVGATMSNINSKAMLETMYRGWLPHLTKFFPSTVACSCAFEFAKRAVSKRKDS